MEFEDVFPIESDIPEEHSCSCPYCGCYSYSSDPDILCPECRADFGHTFYSEL